MATSAATLWKRRGVVRVSITRLGTRLKELEEDAEQPWNLDHTRQFILTKRLDEDFKKHHFELIDMIDDDDYLEREQAVLDKHDDDITSLSVRLQTLLTPSTTLVTPAADSRKLSSRKLSCLQAGLTI